MIDKIIVNDEGRLLYDSRGRFAVGEKDEQLNRYQLALARLLTEIRLNTDDHFYQHCTKKVDGILNGEPTSVQCRGCGKLFPRDHGLTCDNCGVNL